MKYTMFKPGDIVTVQPLEHSMWINGLGHGKAQYVVKAVTPSRRICCSGHPQQLEMTDGITYASGAWFDPLITEKKWCDGNHFDRYW